MKLESFSSILLGMAQLAFHLSREINIAVEHNIFPQSEANSTLAGNSYSVPVAGNSFLTVKTPSAKEKITDTGLHNWVSANTVISTYFRVSKSGKLRIGLKGSVPSGTSVVKVAVGNVSKNVSLTGTTYITYTAGDFDISAPGYVKVDLQGVSRDGPYFADVTDITFQSAAAKSTAIFSNDPSYYYWARRGPSCHLGYTTPTTSNVIYYYNEVTVPVGEDKNGSYFMAVGFKDGYFGIQVNSAIERRVLFSVWSPFETDNPGKIPPEDRVVLNRAGSDVITNDFGAEGSGGQSYYKYNWRAGRSYKFLLKGEPDGMGKTDYTAWFLLPEKSTWKLIASWKRPKTNTYLKNFYSFVENFNADNGYMGRKAEFKNQWVRTTAGDWKVVSSAKFTADSTYTTQQRIDAIGGTKGASFFLQMGGFFSTIVAPDTDFEVTPPTRAPNINLSTLP